MAKKKNSVSGRGLQKSIGKFGGKRVIAILIAIIAIGIAAYFVVSSASADTFTESCKGTKGKCIEQDKPVDAGESVDYKVVVKDKTTKSILDDFKLYLTTNVKQCWKKDGKEHKNGGCSNSPKIAGTVFTSTEINTTSFTARLCSMESRIYQDGNLKGTPKQMYVPCVLENGAFIRWMSTDYTYKDSSGKALGHYKVGAPFGYSSNKTKALSGLNRIKDKIYTINVKIPTGSISSSSSSTTESAASSSGDNYKLVVDNENIAIAFGDNNISKKCNVSVGVTLANKTKSIKRAACNGRGEYNALTISNIAADADHVTFYAYDAPRLQAAKRDIITVPFKNLLSINNGENIIVGKIGSDDRFLTCSLENKTFTCAYAPILREYDSKESTDGL